MCVRHRSESWGYRPVCVSAGGVCGSLDCCSGRVHALYAVACEAERISTENGSGGPVFCGSRMPGHTQTCSMAPGQCGKPSVWRTTYVMTCATRHIRIACTPCAATGPRRFRTHILAGLESGGMRIRNRDTPGRTTPHTRFRTHILANNPVFCFSVPCPRFKCAESKVRILKSPVSASISRLSRRTSEHLSRGYRPVCVSAGGVCGSLDCCSGRVHVLYAVACEAERISTENGSGDPCFAVRACPGMRKPTVWLPDSAGSLLSGARRMS
ncbi:hypothetical protein DSM100238_1061 [Bifidobacterium apri]|uniref:Uncharacterized protein n=1 Tax=Bifidobacterium apri TaxID=1769423 RepID=A0A6A2V8W7_9BIFI|nr:hypothetical protein DSM100238_1061 [Bifidobacterium apri]